MEFMNVGGGELLIIILFALILFSPEDILKLMRTIGKYARTARQMWSNVSKNLREEYLPDEVKEVVKETASTVKEARTTLSGIRQQFNELTTSIEEDVSDAAQLADNELAEVLTTVNDIQVPSQPENSIVGVDVETTDQSSDEILNDSLNQPVEETALLPMETSTTDEIDPSTSPLEAKTMPTENQVIQQTNLEQEDPPTSTFNDMDNTNKLTKDNSTKKQELEGAMAVTDVYAKLTKVREDSLKDGGNDS